MIIDSDDDYTIYENQLEISPSSITVVCKNKIFNILKMHDMKNLLIIFRT